MDISGIKYLGIDRILSRGTGETIAELNNALLVRDNVSGASAEPIFWHVKTRKPVLHCSTVISDQTVVC